MHLIAPNLLLQPERAPRYDVFMKNTVQTQGGRETRATLIGQLLGGLEKATNRNQVAAEAGAIRYRLLQVRGRMAYLQPITETGDVAAMNEYRTQCQMEKVLTAKLESTMRKRMKDFGITRMLMPVL